VVTIGSDGWPALAGAVREVRESRVQDAIVEFLDGTARPPGRRSWAARRGSGRRKSGPWTGCWHPGGSSGRGRVGRGTPTGSGWHRGPIPFPCFRAEYIQRTAARKRKTGRNPRQYWRKAVRWSSARNRVQRTESSRRGPTPPLRGPPTWPRGPRAPQGGSAQKAGFRGYGHPVRRNRSVSTASRRCPLGPGPGEAQGALRPATRRVGARPGNPVATGFDRVSEDPVRVSWYFYLCRLAVLILPRR